MTDRHDSRSYVSRGEILSRIENPIEIKALLYCSSFMNQRYLAAAVWLIASGPSGLNPAEAESLSGLDAVAIDATFHSLRTRGLLRAGSALPGDLGGRFVFDFSRLRLELGETESEKNLENESGKSSDESRKDSGTELATRGAYIADSGNLDPLIGSNKEASKVTLGPPRVTYEQKNQKLKRKILKSTKAQIEAIGPWGPDCLSAVEGEPDGSPLTPQSETLDPRPEMEVVGTIVGNRSVLSEEFRTQKNNQTKKGLETRKITRSYLQIPSENPMVRGWEKKEDPARWKDLDWLGYWLQHYKAFYGAEDPQFVGYLPSQPKVKIRAALIKSDLYYESADRIEQFRDHDRCLRGDSLGLRTFFDWLFGEYLPNADWIRDPVGVIQVTRLASNHWLEKFKARHIKVKGKETKGKGRWRPWGYETE